MSNRLSLAELRKAVVNDPRNAQLRHLLGAEMAQQKDYDGAVMEMSAAIAFNPLLHLARFQLGLLHLTMGRPDHALSVLAPLENLNDNSPLKHFKRGLEALIVDDFVRCIDGLQTGIKLNTDNELLNRDMQSLLERIRETAGKQQKSGKDEKMPPSPEKSSERRQDSAGPVRTDFSLYNSH
jgi:tetratricopeptide (TPR) repeat protein